MKIVFDASNSLEAHLLLGILNQAGIAGKISGEYLQGAMGELPAFGLVKVHVDESDYDEAREIIAEWQNTFLA